jgi:hypothetical protein
MITERTKPMKIKEVFEKKIDREINGVVKVERDKDKKDEEALREFQEIDEFVVTKELRRHFYEFYKNYNYSLDHSTEKIGCWISGFFGSGKSHLLKILSWLLENKVVEGLQTIESFEKKLCDDKLLFNEIKRASNYSTDALLFNIASKSSSEGTEGKSSIVEVFMKVFNEKQGYCGEIPWIADIERIIAEDGYFDSFKEAYKEITGEDWEKARKKNYFIRDYFIKALRKAKSGMSEESAALLFDNAENNYSLSPEKFAGIIKEYLDKKGKNHRIVFMVDEMGFYIGENTSLMLNLQTVTENLGIFCKGRAWVIVTSQEAIDSLTKERLKDQDFSKIQGRFDTRMNLSSSNTDEVIKRRLLEKKSFAKETLEITYKDHSAGLKNLISFSPNTAGMKSYQNYQEFIEVYPFIPYQFNLLQHVFECIRKFSHAGKNLSEGERSMLNAFHLALKAHSDYDISRIIPFQFFYSTVESFLDGNIKRIIEQAKENVNLEDFDVEVLQVLFMIKYVKGMPADVDNLSTLMIETIDDDKITLRNKINASLARLKKEILIQQNGELYDFLTDEEQDVNRGIKAVKIDFGEIITETSRRIFDEIYPDKAYRYSKFNIYSFSREIDGKTFGKAGEELIIKIFTPESGDYQRDDESFKMLSMGGSILLIRMPKDRKYLDEIEEILKTQEYIKQKSDIQISENIRKIINIKNDEIIQRKKRVTGLLEEALEEAGYYVSQNKLTPEGNSGKAKIENALKVLVQNTFHKLEFIGNNMTSESEIKGILSGKIQQSLGPGNKKAEDDVANFITQKYEWEHRPVTMKEIKERYHKKPYGWAILDIAGILAKLFYDKVIKFEYSGEDLEGSDNNLINYLTKEKEFDKLVIHKKSGPGGDLIEAAKKAGKEIFDCMDLPDDGDKLFEELNEETVREVSSLKLLLNYYNNTAYPGKDILKHGISLFGEILCFKKDISKFLQTLVDKKDELIKWKKSVSSVKEFFDGKQMEIFDRALYCLKMYEDNKFNLEDDEVKSHIGELQAIVNEQSPYSKIKDIPYWELKFKEKYVIMLAIEKDVIKNQIEEDWKIVESNIKENDKDFEAELRKPFEDLIKTVEKAENFNLSNFKAKGNDLIKKSLVKINGKYNKPFVTGTTVTQPGIDPGPLVLSPVELSPVKIAGHKKLLKSEQDVEEYISKLRDALKNAMKGDKMILLT